uniref:baculoviral IAP repeat-containing protein 7-B isoform X1 n=1 Tax=Ciona intestinalis TaxID=7719 RepID=UPI000521C723|nr:baculoviral IAP repeat-containing protein 7-B isoform X1 [Ciona intestinalis]|eukprot:XP_009861875.1 baculoviral IAP repeat-containing protein 7-B isoform X1 [Ciona intestinalis]
MQARMMDIRCDGLRVVHNDGRLVPSATNSERELYTRPGDPYYESYRLATFTNYPNQNINVRQVARAGFYFISYQDQVKCFSCGQICEDLQQYDDMSLPQWHLPDCEHLHSLQPNRNNHANTPVQSGLSRPNENATFRSLPTRRPAHSNVHSSSSLPRQPTTITINQPRIRSTFTIHEHSNIDLFPCNRPESPHMRSVEQRLQTFTRSNWPAHRVRASILDISRAGLFYLGNSDRTKCWYCNGGLQNWEPNDDPWYEHAKWFPECEFLLQQKGIEYVYRVSSQFPNLQRPVIVRSQPQPSVTIHINRPGRTTMPTASTTHTTSSTRISAPRSTVVSGPQFLPPMIPGPSINIIDPREQPRSREEELNRYITTSPYIAVARGMGFDDEAIRSTLRRQHEQSQRFFSSAEELVDALLNQSNITSAPQIPSSSTAGATGGPITPLEELRQLEQSRMCKVCHRNQANMVLLPCGHVACCTTCGNDVTNCPVCLADITDRVRSYIG